MSLKFVNEQQIDLKYQVGMVFTMNEGLAS